MREVIKLSSRDIYVAFDEHKSGRYAQHVLSVKKFSKKTFNAITIAPVPNYIISKSRCTELLFGLVYAIQ